MLSLDLARKLKETGLVWVATDNDYFAIPDRGLDEQIFVLADLQAQLDIFRGWPVVTFHGTAEWALDYILTSEVVWIPREDQLIDALMSLLPADAGQQITLDVSEEGARCTVSWGNQTHSFAASSTADACGQALLFALEKSKTT